MAYGLEIKLADGTLLSNQSTKGGRIFLQKIELAASSSTGTTTTYTYPTVADGSYLRVIPVGAKPLHTWAAGTSSGQATLTLTQKAVSPYYAGDITTRLFVFATYHTESASAGLSDYGISTINDAGERVVSTSYPVIQFLGKMTFNTTPWYSYTSIPSSYTVYNYNSNSNSISIAPYQSGFIVWSLPSTTSDVWFFPGEVPLDDIPLDSGESTYFNNPSGSAAGISAVCAVYRQPATSWTLPEAFVFAVDHLTASSDTYGLRIKDSSGNITFDSGLHHGSLAGFETLAGYPLTTANSNTNSTFSGITPAITIPTYGSMSIDGTFNGNFFAGFVRRNGTTLYSKQINYKSYPGYSSTKNWSYSAGSKEIGQLQLVINATDYGGTAFS